MSSLQANSEVQSIEIEAVVIRADGTIEDLGTVSSWHRPESLLRRLATQVLHILRR